MQNTTKHGRRRSLATIACVAVLGVIGAVTATAAAAGGGPPIKGAGTASGADDIGTCNNVWAEDNLTKKFTLTATRTSGVYSLKVKEDGSFVSNSGSSPGACESGSDNGSTIAAGVLGKLSSHWRNTVTATTAPNRKPDCSSNACGSSTGFLDAVFGPGNWTKGDWSWKAHYTAPGGHGTWFDTNVNWPLNDRGDIT
jgi:hypothetical protein